MQTHPDVEYIVIDGASSDGTRELLERAETTCGLRWLSEPDGGMYDAINKGLKMARGEMVSWVNSDDWLLPWAAEAAAEHSRGAKSAVYSDILTASVGSSVSVPRIAAGFSRARLAAVGTLPQPSVFWPRMAVPGLTLDASRYSEVADCDYWLRLSQRLKFRKIREFTAITFDHPDAKRFANSELVSQELADIRARHGRPAAPNLWWRSRESLAWRAEWARLLVNHEWKRSNASGLANISALSRPLHVALRRWSPLHRSPLTKATVDISVYMQVVEAKVRTLGLEPS